MNNIKVVMNLGEKFTVSVGYNENYNTFFISASDPNGGPLDADIISAENPSKILYTLRSFPIEQGEEIILSFKNVPQNLKDMLAKIVREQFNVVTINSAIQDVKDNIVGGFKKYEDVNKVSGIDAYLIGKTKSGKNYISIRFKGGVIYTYFESKIGPTNFKNMSGMARNGFDLNGYIMKNPLVKHGGRKEKF